LSQAGLIWLIIEIAPLIKIASGLALQGG